MLWFQLISILLVFRSFRAAKIEMEKVNYCNFKCGNKHIACNYKQTNFLNNVAVVQLNKTIRNLILSLHNDKRNEVASGQLQHLDLPPATRMAKMKWNAELAYLAQIKALRYSRSYDECRSTKKFAKPGQTIAWMRYKRTNQTDGFILKMLVKNRVEDWLSSNSICRLEHINILNNAYNIPNNCDFALAVIDKNTDIGCAAVHLQIKLRNYFHLVCNYAHTYKRGQVAYKTGFPAMLCNTGNDDEYENLCSANENYE